VAFIINGSLLNNWIRGPIDNQLCTKEVITRVYKCMFVAGAITSIKMSLKFFCVELIHCKTLTTRTHTHTFNGPFSGTTRASRYQKGKTIWILLKQETVSGSGNSWDICKSAPHSRQITTPAPHHSVFYRQYAIPATQPTATKH